jgi:TPR repeat protein
VIRLLRAILTIGCLLGLTPAAAAGPYEDGVAAAKRGDFVTAVRLWRPLAHAGNVDAETWLCRTFLRAEFVDGATNAALAPGEGLAECQAAADHGDLEAQYAMGELTMAGVGLPKDPVRGADWFRQAADQGYALAQLQLGLCFRIGSGVPRDPVQAYKWLQLGVNGVGRGAASPQFARLPTEEISPKPPVAR